MDYERIQKPSLNNAVGGGLSPRKLRNMLLGVDKKRRDDTEPDSTLDLQLPEAEDSGNSSSDNCKDVDVVNVAAQRVSLAPFSKPAPSKWDDAQKWIASPTSNRPNLGHSKSQKATLLGYGRQSSMKVVLEVVPDQRSVASVEPDTKRIDSSYDKPVLMIEDSAISLSQHESRSIQSATTFVSPPSTARSVSMRDMGTEMTPAASQEPSRTGTPVKATTPSSSRPSTPPKTPPSSTQTHLPHNRPNSVLSHQEQQLQTRKEIIALGTQLGKYSIAAWASKDKEDENETNQSSSAKPDTDPQMGPTEMRAAAWEEAERAKYTARFKREEMRIEAWENHQKAKSEAEMRKVEVEVERIRGKAQDKLMNKLAAVRLKAEEKLAAAEAQRNRRAAKTEQQSEYIRKTGQIPSSSSSFSFSFCWCCS